MEQFSKTLPFWKFQKPFISGEKSSERFDAYSQFQAKYGSKGYVGTKEYFTSPELAAASGKSASAITSNLTEGVNKIMGYSSLGLSHTGRIKIFCVLVCMMPDGSILYPSYHFSNVRHPIRP